MTGNTARIYFESDGSGTYYGYWATVTGTGIGYALTSGDPTLTPTRGGYTFAGWKDSDENIISVSQPTSSTNETYTAKWLKNFKVKFDPTGGTTPTETITVTDTLAYSNSVSSFPTPTRSGYHFEGWYTKASGGARVYIDSIASKVQTTLYAHWTEEFTVTMNPTGGSVSPTTITVTDTYAYDFNIDSFPTPTRSGYYFDGWYTEASGGTQVYIDSIASKSQSTLYAHWLDASLYVVQPRSLLGEYTWTEIKQLSDALVDGTITENELGSTYNIRIGDYTDYVSITPSGGTAESHQFRLIGLNHDVDASGNTLGMTFEQADLMNNYYIMKLSSTSSDSWDNSDLKTTINNFTLQSDLNSVITSAKKTCVTSVTDSTLTYVTSKLWILSETEILGTQTGTYGNAVEGTQYAYYVSRNTNSARLKTMQRGVNSNYWLRSATSWYSGNSASFFNGIYGDGGSGSSFRCWYAYNGVSICFCI